MARVEARNGRWRARVFAPDGRERSRTFDKKSDADRWAREQETAADRGAWVDPALGRITFATYAAQWRDGLHHREQTLARYDTVLRVHLLPRFGDTRLARITRPSVQAMVSADARAGYSSSEVRLHVDVLRQVLQTAVRDRRLAVNAADDIDLPPLETRPMRILTEQQLADLAAAIGDHYAPLVLAAGWLGLRFGELAGLRLDRVDLLRHKVRVDQQLVELAGRLRFGPPKTKASLRTVTIPEGLTEVLARHFACKACQTSRMAFPTVTGALLRRTNFGRVWGRAVSARFDGTQWERLRPHELRHTAASLAIAVGAHPKTIQERLGHSSITITMDLYGHLFDDADEALAQALNERFRAPSESAFNWPGVSDLERKRRSAAHD